MDDEYKDYEDYLIDTNLFLNSLMDICDNAPLEDGTASKINFLCEMFKEKTDKISFLVDEA